MASRRSAGYVQKAEEETADGKGKTLSSAPQGCMRAYAQRPSNRELARLPNTIFHHSLAPISSIQGLRLRLPTKPQLACLLAGTSSFPRSPPPRHQENKHPRSRDSKACSKHTQAPAANSAQRGKRKLRADPGGFRATPQVGTLHASASPSPQKNKSTNTHTPRTSSTEL